MKIDRLDKLEMIERRKNFIKEGLDFCPITCKHFKGEFYEILGIATHTETREELVVYRNKYKDREMIWTRPIDMFLSYLDEKDKEKYPDTVYRLTLYNELNATKEQIENTLSLKKMLQVQSERIFAKSVLGQIYNIVNIIHSNEFYAVVIDDDHTIPYPESKKKLIHVAELFSDNFKILQEKEISVGEFIQASQLSEQIRRSNGWK